MCRRDFLVGERAVSGDLGKQMKRGSEVLTKNGAKVGVPWSKYVILKMTSGEERTEIRKEMQPMKKRRFPALFLVLAMVVSLTVPAGAADTAAAGDMAGEIVILHTNDVHGAVDGYAKVAALKDAYEARGAYVLLMDAGDFIQGDPAVSTSRGTAAVELMNLAGYDVATLGNHEFDYGYENLKTLEKAAQFPIVDLNVFYDAKVSVAGGHTSMEKAAFDSHVIFTAPDGTRIGVFGLTTPETATKANPAKLQGITFLAGEELFDLARAEVQMLEDAHCAYIICLGHLGIDAESAGNRSMDLLEHVDGIDLFIDGHSHSTQEEILVALGGTQTQAGSVLVTTGTDMVNGAVLTSAGTKLENVGVVTIDKSGRVFAKSYALESLTDADQTVADRAAAIRAEIDRDYGTVFARTEADLNGEQDPGSRTGETNLGDLITDALAWGAEQEGTGVDAAVINGGSIRASIARGDITRKDIHTVLPFDNTLSVVRVTGGELLEALEASTYCTPAPLGGFPQVSGMTFTVDAAKAYDWGDRYPDSTYCGPGSIQRVSIQTVGGRAFDENATYTIATNDFVAAGGDTYAAFAAASVNYDLGLAVDEVVMDYITDELGGVVTAGDYGQPAGRITVETELPFTDVTVQDFYYDAVKYCYDNGIFQGVTDTTFAPLSTMTRGQMVTVLWRMNGSPVPAGACPFADVAADSPFRQAIAWAAENGLTNGTTATTFAPDQAISCQQFLTILYRYAQFMEYDVSKTATITGVYADWEAVSGYAQEAMEWAVGSGVLVADKALRPTKAAVRYEVAQFLANFCRKVVPQAEAQQAA